MEFANQFIERRQQTLKNLHIESGNISGYLEAKKTWLIVNDDGYQEQRVYLLEKAIRELYQEYGLEEPIILMVLPTGHESAQGVNESSDKSEVYNSIAEHTWDHSIQDVQLGNNTKLYTYNGTPVEAIEIVQKNDVFKKYTIDEGRVIDIVISGPNNQHNIGSNIQLSGTIANCRAAKIVSQQENDRFVQNVPTFALSDYNGGEFNSKISKQQTIQFEHSEEQTFILQESFKENIKLALIHGLDSSARIKNLDNTILNYNLHSQISPLNQHNKGVDEFVQIVRMNRQIIDSSKMSCHALIPGDTYKTQVTVDGNGTPKTTRAVKYNDNTNILDQLKQIQNGTHPSQQVKEDNINSTKSSNRQNHRDRSNRGEPLPNKSFTLRSILEWFRNLFSCCRGGGYNKIED